MPKTSEKLTPLGHQEIVGDAALHVERLCGLMGALRVVGEMPRR
ncbi:MAG: hypothetical protein ACYTGL_22460 [Planctomycetota bacterium]